MKRRAVIDSSHDPKGGRETMLHRRGPPLPILPVLVLALFLVGCPKRPATTSAAAPAPGAPAPGTPGAGPSVAGPGAPGAPAAPGAPGAATTPGRPGAAPSPREFAVIAALQDIHFDFDKYEIRPGAPK